MRTALLSVFEKAGIVEFARDLRSLGFDLLASGGTAQAIAAAGLAVRDVAALVGGGAILGHRVVTLSRELHAGLLATDSEADQAELARLGIPRIDLVCVDMYPLQAEITKPESTTASVIEKTDIGGPTMLRSAAKGGRIVVCDPVDRECVVEWLKAGEPNADEFKRELAAKAEAVVARYCLASAYYHSQGQWAGVVGRQVLACRYGENAWQTPAGLFTTDVADPLALDKFQVLTEMAPSYNNLCDVDRLLQTMTHIAAVFDVNRGFVPLMAVGVKHGNACGAAYGPDPLTVLRNMIVGDTQAIFGGLVMVNFQIGAEEAGALLHHLLPPGQRRLLDGIVAPSFTPDAVEQLRRKADKCRLLVNPALGSLDRHSLDSAPRFRYVRGGFLRQPNYTFVPSFSEPAAVSNQEEEDMFLAWAVGSTSNSNTITLVKDGHVIGNGVGQHDRFMGSELAVRRAVLAGNKTRGAVAYSDSFFPFTDGPAVLAVAGVKTILASSGSVKDDEVKKFCQDHGISLYLVPDAEARGFFGH